MDLRSYFSFRGRLARRGFWIYYVLPVCAFVGVEEVLGLAPILGVLVKTLVAPIFWLGMARRFQDLGYSLGFLVVLRSMVALFITRGTKGPNRFGEDPLDSLGGTRGE